MLFEELMPSVDQLMGVKAVFGPLRGRAVCFASRGDAQLKNKAHFRTGRTVAEYAEQRPFLITIGGGSQVRDGLGGHVLNVARVSKAYGETNAFYLDPEDQARLAQWPVATGLLDVYEVAGFPHLVEALGLPDRTILANAFDIVVRPEEKVSALWDALRGHELNLVDLPPLPNFREPDSVTLVGTSLPKRVSKEEGQRLYREVQIFERKSDLAKLARQANRDAHDGIVTCDACGFSDDLDGMLDVHHLVPLMLGVRETTLSDLVVLCPTCHRWAHRKGGSNIDPLPLNLLKSARRAPA